MIPAVLFLLQVELQRIYCLGHQRDSAASLTFSRPGIHWVVIETHAPCPGICACDYSTMGVGPSWSNSSSITLTGLGGSDV